MRVWWRVGQDCMRSCSRLRNGSRGVERSIQYQTSHSKDNALTLNYTHNHADCSALLSTRSQQVWFSNRASNEKLAVNTIGQEWRRQPITAVKILAKVIRGHFKRKAAGLISNTDSLTHLNLKLTTTSFSETNGNLQLFRENCQKKRENCFSSVLKKLQKVLIHTNYINI